jgi:chemotaxis protein CheD
MNHYLLPYWSANENASTRFGNVAIEYLIRKILALGGSKEGLQGKLFGGASINQELRGKEMDLGSKNIEVALNLLSSEGIPIVASDVGGTRGRKVVLDTFNGIVFVKQL